MIPWPVAIGVSAGADGGEVAGCVGVAGAASSPMGGGGLSGPTGPKSGIVGVVDFRTSGGSVGIGASVGRFIGSRPVGGGSTGDGLVVLDAWPTPDTDTSRVVSALVPARSCTTTFTITGPLV